MPQQKKCLCGCSILSSACLFRTALEQIEERARAKAHAMSVDEESFLSTIAGLKKKVGRRPDRKADSGANVLGELCMVCVVCGAQVGSLEETVEDLAAALREAREGQNSGCIRVSRRG